MKKLLALLVVALFGASIAFGQAATITENEVIPLDMGVFVPCANDGLGEVVLLSGELHTLYHLTVNKNNYSYKDHTNPQGVSGVGVITGDMYQGTGVTQYQESGSWSGFPFESTYVNNFRVIGQGPGNNYTVHETVHVTINANGELTANVVNVKVECQ